MLGKGFFGHRVKLAGLGVALDFFIEKARIEFGIPLAELGLFVFGEFKNGLFDLLEFGHIALLRNQSATRASQPGYLPLSIASQSCSQQIL